MRTCSLKEKLTSGRRFLVFVAGLVLLGLASCVVWRLAHVFKDPQQLAIYVALFGQILTVVAMVYKDYFNRDRTGENGDSDNGGDDAAVPPVK